MKTKDIKCNMILNKQNTIPFRANEVIHWNQQNVLKHEIKTSKSLIDRQNNKATK